MMSLNDFIHKHKLKNNEKSNKKTQQVFSRLYQIDVGVCLGDGPFESDLSIVNLQPTK